MNTNELASETLNTIQILASNTSIVAERLSRIARLAERNNLPIPTANFGEKYMTTQTNEVGLTFDICVRDVTVDMPRIGLQGWKLVATIDHDAAGNIIRTAPGFDGNVPVEFRTSGPDRCDHCGTSRLRSKTIIVHHDDEGFRQVGGDCVKVYLGLNVENALVVWDAIESFNEGGFARREVAVTEFLAAAALVISLYGYKSKSACEFGGTPTASIVAQCVNPNNDTRKTYPEFFQVDATMAERASKLAVLGREWVAGLSGNSDFESNMITAINRSAVGKNGGFLAYACEGYRRSVEQAAAKADLPTSTYQGEVGGKVTVQGCKVVYMNRSDGYAYNSPDNLYVVLVGADGTKLSLSTTVATKLGELLENADDDARFDIVGTVKSHEMYRGEQTTKLTRCKAV